MISSSAKIDGVKDRCLVFVAACCLMSMTILAVRSAPEARIKQALWLVVTDVLVLSLFWNNMAQGVA